ncbi:Alkanal monooxygenase alpha chain [Pseudonocardia sp. Ae406_Ps2]|uniref:LLM class flavin-dependent oxidoreductase n=1 Tax=unclassified Pseudonocardia TaxID=2619320 RepID=UPI00094B344C|nr:MULTISPECIES: LLM class flavin-dependent oxidoreductase [unclassified Pseudonocardia]OLM01292.1 Alkanal monooxygenase alpha chain [Pseudonocardia sp. Ae406_Ps2]OLM06911.1 Alkanal monooxygenase alpha chain [Pseudonocardia sp. Ae331_Ps2]OLM14087.1 Alkanal monooxygenase alpha chain [Pseudonocardia sp. Ae505_Ps2]OLM22865.1 Alkanal monooxygenase alpha chain [Pseudonocardia sp. Ae706_Ps2]OLM31265.1 Alkanal monooxygenase alpha chain [Pseudonocardia sp. Ae717_Ps2]
MKLGFLTHVHGPGRPAADVYRDVVDTVVAAEELGFDSAWIAQHHLRGDYGRLPSPLLVLAAAAQRTRRIRLGTAVTVLPLEPPLRLAEDAAVLDALSGGRVELGLGSGGANQDAFGAFGARVEDRHAQFDERLAVLRAALRGEPVVEGLAEAGLPGGAASTAVLQPPAPGLADRLWQSTSDPSRAAAVARAGDGLLLGTATHDPETVQRPLAEAYRAALTGPGRVAAVRAVFPAADRATARDDLAPALDVHRQAFVRHGLTELAELTTDQYLRRINVHLGAPDEIVLGLARDPGLGDLVDELVVVVSHERSEVAADIARLEVVAREIAPALGWSPAREAVA